VAGEDLHGLALARLLDFVITERGVHAAVVHQVPQHRCRDPLVGQRLGVRVAKSVRVDSLAVKGHRPALLLSAASIVSADYLLSSREVAEAPTDKARGHRLCAAKPGVVGDPRGAGKVGRVISPEDAHPMPSDLHHRSAS
jgi:hypothetical protein